MKGKVGVSVLCLFTIACSTPVDRNEQQSFDPISYNIIMGDRLAGSQESWREDDGTYRFQFEFNDRGRGPRYDESIRLDEDGYIEYQSVVGVDYLKDSIDELFRITEGQAVWKNSAEEGYEPYEAHTYYSSVDGSFGSIELLVQILLKNSPAEIPLIPGGSVRLVEIKDVLLADSLDVRLVSITGLGFTPNHIWMDENDRLFAAVSGKWFTVVQKGFDSLRNEMIAVQKEVEDKFYHELAAELTEIPENGIAITHVNVFDPETGGIDENQVVIVRENKIEWVGDADADDVPDYSEEVHVVDGTGKMLMPGLFDMHGHLSEVDGILNIAGGVTSARDLANDTTILSLRKNFDSNQMIGPRLVTVCGFIDGAGPYTGPTGQAINNVEEGKKSIDYYSNLGYPQIKLYSSIKPEWVKPMVDYAHEKGMKVSGHIPAYMTARQAVENGYDEIQHINMIFLNFFSDTIDTRTPLRFTMVAEHGSTVDPGSDVFDSFARLLRAEDIVVDPTVTIFEGMFTAVKGEASPSYSMIVDRLPVQVRRGFFTGGLPIPEDKKELYAASHRRMLEVVKALYDRGITIVPGTDGLVGFTLHRELELYNKAGIPANEVLIIATLGAAKVVGRENDLGSIESGKLADMILIDGNPVQNISDIRKVELVIKDGRIYDPEKLYSALGVKHFK